MCSPLVTLGLPIDPRGSFAWILHKLYWKAFGMFKLRLGPPLFVGHLPSHILWMIDLWSIWSIDLCLVPCVTAWNQQHSDCVLCHKYTSPLQSTPTSDITTRCLNSCQLIVVQFNINFYYKDFYKENVHMLTETEHKRKNSGSRQKWKLTPSWGKHRMAGK